MLDVSVLNKIYVMFVYANSMSCDCFVCDNALMTILLNRIIIDVGTLHLY